MRSPHRSILLTICLLASTTGASLSCIPLPDLPEATIKTPGALFDLQRQSTAIWAQAYADKDVDTLLDYTMDPYIQHNPGAPSGKAIAAVGLTMILSDPAIVNNVTRVISDLDYVALHVHRQQPGTLDKAIVDIFRLNGTCITEHWDVQQVMYPNATNPLAYF